MNEVPEIPASAPILNAGNRVFALYPRSWTNDKGRKFDSIVLAEVVPASSEKATIDGKLVHVTTSWKRKFRGLQLGLETK